MAAAFDSDPICMRPALSVRGLTVARPELDEPMLRAVDLSVRRGECVLLRGVTGSGKTTLLRTIAGLDGGSRRSGQVELRGTHALLLQTIETQLLCPTVEEEIALGLRNRTLPAEALADAVQRELARVGLAGFESRQVDSLSAGQKLRVVIASLLAMRPRILMLDEPFSALDEPSRRGLVEVLRTLKRTGTALLVAEHHAEDLLPIVDRVLRLADGALFPEHAGLGASAAPGAVPGRKGADAETAHRGEPIGPDASTRVPVPATLAAIADSDRLLVCGPNGSGKSTLLRQLAATGSPTQRVALVIQDPRRSLCQRTVGAEIAFSLERAGRLQARDDRPGVERRVRQLLQRFALQGFAARSPRRLSHGQQHRLAMAAALAHQPDIALLDEPFSGLDAEWRERLLAILATEQAEAGTRFILASHDTTPLAQWCGKRVELSAAGRTPC